MKTAINELDQQPERGDDLVGVKQGWGLSRRDVRARVRHQLIVRAFIDRRIRLFVRIPESQIVQYDQDHRQMIGEPLDEAVRE